MARQRKRFLYSMDPEFLVLAEQSSHSVHLIYSKLVPSFHVLAILFVHSLIQRQDLDPSPQRQWGWRPAHLIQAPFPFPTTSVKSWSWMSLSFSSVKDYLANAR